MYTPKAHSPNALCIGSLQNTSDVTRESRSTWRRSQLGRNRAAADTEPLHVHCNFLPSSHIPQLTNLSVISNNQRCQTTLRNKHYISSSKYKASHAIRLRRRHGRYLRNGGPEQQFRTNTSTPTDKLSEL